MSSKKISLLSLLLITITLYTSCISQNTTKKPALPPPAPARQASQTHPAIKEITLSDSDAQRIGRMIWQNESGGRREGLIVWNVGEEFPSLGIGHFIWYPVGYRGPFEESFPALVQYFLTQGITVPKWAEGQCPWPDRETFLKLQNTPAVEELRALLERTTAHQARFAAQRLRNALPRILAASDPGTHSHIISRFNAVQAIPHGIYALMDYVNFKGEGTNPTERYNGQGWGLLQVLELMPNRAKNAPPEIIMEDFSNSAWAVLERRIQNSPLARGESRWAAGWRNRCQTYKL